MADDSVGFFFNVEKWFGSTAVRRMSYREKGVYLEMMLQQWRERTRNLPDSPDAVADLITITPEQAADVAAAWAVVRRKFVTSKHDPRRIYNIEVECTRRKQRANRRNRENAGRAGGKASAAKRWGTKELSGKQSLTVVTPPSTDKNREDKKRIDQRREESASKRPIYQSDRFVVFDWQLLELERTLGPHTEAFDLHAFFDDLTQRSRQQGLVIPSDRDERWRWLQAQVEAEAKRRGLPMAGAPSKSATADPLVVAKILGIDPEKAGIPRAGR